MMRRRLRVPDDPSDLRQVILPLLSLGFTSIVLLNLARLVIYYGSPVFLSLWAPNALFGLSVILVLIIIAFLWAVLLAIIAFGEPYPSRVIGGLLKTSLIVLGVLAITYGFTLRASGWKAIAIMESVCERDKDQDGSQPENFGDIQAVVEMFRRSDPAEQ